MPKQMTDQERQEFLAEPELENPGPELVLFTIRPDRWLTADFSEEDKR
jgi:hypothetical protein